MNTLRDPTTHPEESNAPIRTSISNLTNGIQTLRVLGYGLLVLAFFDLISLLTPLDFMNPVWELQTFGKMVERVPIPLIGLTLIFLGKREKRSRWEVSALLKCFSLIAMTSGVVMFLMGPLIIIDTFRVNNVLQAQARVQTTTQHGQMQQVEQQLQQVQSREDLEAFLTQFQLQGLISKLPRTENFNQIKEQLGHVIEQESHSINTRERKTFLSQRQTLLKNAIKWTLGSLVSGFLFIYIWLGSRSIW